MNQSKHSTSTLGILAMKQTLFLIGSILILFGCNSHSNINSNASAIGANNSMLPEQSCTLLNKVEYASFKYTSSDLFKTGKVSKPALTLSADTLIIYNGKKYQVKLNYFDVRNALFGVGTLSTGNTTVLLFTKEKQFHYLEVKGVGSFEFKGTKGDKNYFKFSLNDCTTYFSLGLNQPDVLITEYSVEAE
jgi:hypothetical protein